MIIDEKSPSLTMSAVSSSFGAHYDVGSEKNRHFALVEGLRFPTWALC